GPPRDRRTHRRVFAGRLEFGSELNGIVCTDQDLDAPVPAADPTMARYVQGYLETIAARTGPTTAGKVRELVWVLLPSGRCSVEHVAERLGVDRRTVHRHLAREGTSFSAILDAARTEMVTRYIGEPGKRLYVVAELLGFSALSAF